MLIDKYSIIMNFEIYLLRKLFEENQNLSNFALKWVYDKNVWANLHKCVLLSKPIQLQFQI